MKHSLIRHCLALAVATLLSGPLFSQVSQAGVSPQEARTQLDRVVEDLAASTQQSPKLYQELHDLLLAAPDLVDRIPSLLKRGDVSLEVSATLIYALEDIGSGGTQKSLASIHADPTQRHMDRLRAAVSLGAVSVATDANLASLWAAAERWGDPQAVDLAGTSLLALGCAGRRLRDAGAPAYASVRDDLLRRLRTTPRSFERVATVKALGNLRDLTLGGEISNYFNDSSAPVRAATAQTLGMLADATHREVLVVLLPMEAHGAVRAAMAEALREIPADQASLGAVLALVRNERDTQARAQMVRYLVEHLREFDESRETLRQMVLSDPANEVRLLASTVLSF